MNTDVYALARAKKAAKASGAEAAPAQYHQAMKSSNLHVEGSLVKAENWIVSVLFLYSVISKSISRASTRMVAVFAEPAGPERISRRCAIVKLALGRQKRGEKPTRCFGWLLPPKASANHLRTSSTLRLCTARSFKHCGSYFSTQRRSSWGNTHQLQAQEESADGMPGGSFFKLVVAFPFPLASFVVAVTVIDD